MVWDIFIMAHNLWLIYWRLNYIQCRHRKTNKNFKENINGTHTFAASCQEYFDLGNRINGSFKIRPNPELHAFEVECEFNESQGLTILRPMEWNQNGFTFPETEDQRCSEANCFTHSFEYSASNQQIEVKTTQKVEINYYNISGDSEFINDLHSVD